MIDAPGRASPRFPASAESAVRAAIRASISSLAGEDGSSCVGVAGGACGGDILFHEICQELDIATRMLLALPPAAFLEQSVRRGGQDWVERFQVLLKRLGSRNILVMPRGDGQPEDQEDIWQRANLWMIEEALRLARHCTLLALWDGKGGDGPGGTEHLVRVAAARGMKVAPFIPMQSLAG